MKEYERLSVVVSLVLLGLVTTLIVEVPKRTVTTYVLGSPLSVPISGQRVVGLLIVGMAIAGTDYALREHPRYRNAGLRYSLLFWIVPGIVTLAAVWLIPRLLTQPLLWLAGLLLTGFTLASVIAAEQRTIAPDTPGAVRARLYLNLITYAAALAMFTNIYGTRVRSLVSGPATIMVATVLALALLRIKPGALRRTWVYSVVIGLILGQTLWALNYWRVSALGGGLLLLLVFYFCTGIAQQELLGRYSRRVLLEYLGITAVSLLILATQFSFGG